MADDFDDPVTPSPATAPAASARPEPRRDQYGRYLLPSPQGGPVQAWRRATTLIKYASDEYHLNQWKLRSAIKGIAARPDLVALASTLDVKRNKGQMNSLVEKALDAAGATAGASLGTALHGMSETLDETGSMEGIPEQYRPRMEEYTAALAAKGITVVRGFIERITVSQRYLAAGTLDRVYQLSDGTYVIGDLKTGSTLDFGFKEIEAQLALYADGVNSGGVWTGKGWDTSLKVSWDLGIVVHLPSGGEGCTVYRAELANGRRLLEACTVVRDERVHKSPVVEYHPPEPEPDWNARLDGAATYAALLAVVDQARAAGAWDHKLSNVARLRAASLV